jgi:hypothetical protein
MVSERDIFVKAEIFDSVTTDTYLTPKFSTLGPCRPNECCQVSVYVSCGRFSVHLEMIITLNYVRIMCRGWGVSHCWTQRATDLVPQILILKNRSLRVMNVMEPTTKYLGLNTQKNKLKFQLQILVSHSCRFRPSVYFYGYWTRFKWHSRSTYMQ